MAILRHKVGDQVYERMLSMILEGELPQGSRIDYNLLGEDFQTSRVPLREAVQRLVSEGLLVLNPRGGTFVIKLTTEDISYLFSIRRFLEEEAVRRNFELINREKLRQLRDVFLKEAELISRNETYKTTPSIYNSDLELHTEIVIESSGNQIVKHYVGIIYNYTKLAQKLNERMDSSNKEHISIINSILENDKNRTLTAINVHLTQVEKSIIECIKNKGN